MDMAIRICSAGGRIEGPAPKRIVTGFGFWIFLLSDIVMFSCFFAAYAVLLGQTAGGPSGAELFDLRNVAVETAFLLLSSFTCGLGEHRGRRAQCALVPARHGGDLPVRARLSRLEFREFADLVAPRRRPDPRAPFCRRSSHWSDATALHVSAGTLWLLTMMAQVFAKGFRADIMRRLLCFALFWHVLDIIWVAIFSVVYLLGSAA